MVYVGVDGCKKGWFTVGLGGKTGWEVNRFDDIRKLWEQYKNAKLILIDIPIGLRDSGNNERTCDKEARKLLGPKRGTSVFPVPCRLAIYAEPLEKASEINQEKTGRGLSEQSLAIIQKIRQVDELLLRNEVARSRIREIHPEVCFWALNNCQPMRYSKKKVEGFEERREVLSSVFPHTDDLVNCTRQKYHEEYRRREVVKDDVLDALVAAVTASKEKQGLSTIPEKPEADSKGLSMEMVYT
jgi:predicted RNase H-like nuclease